MAERKLITVFGATGAQGEGVPKDAKRALALFVKACQQKDEQGCANGRALQAAGS